MTLSRKNAGGVSARWSSDQQKVSINSKASLALSDDQADQSDGDPSANTLNATRSFAKTPMMSVNTRWLYVHNITNPARNNPSIPRRQ